MCRSFLFLCLSILALSCSSNGDDVSPPESGGGTSTPVSKERDSTNAIYRQFFFSGTHNSYSGNLGGMKREGIKTQLERGLRFFEFDLFTFDFKNDLHTTWHELVDGYFMLDYNDVPYLFTYSQGLGVLKAYLLDNGGKQMVYDNLNDPFEAVERRFYTLKYGSADYFLGYVPSNGYLNVYQFNGSSITKIGAISLGVEDAKLYTFTFEGKSYIGILAENERTYTIKEISIYEDRISLGNSLYTKTSVPLGESINPFTQNNKLYLFSHNKNTVTNYKVESIKISESSWSIENSVMRNSSLLSGTILAIQSNDKIYVNSYTANGAVIGAQLIIEGEVPELAFEYYKSDDLLTSAISTFHALDSGYYFLLRKGAEVQLMSINIGELTIGHDAPGDEVDLNVDNPSSILLEDWINYMAQWSNAHPNHEPLFIMTELKEYEQWLADAKWRQIIYLMQEKFGRKLRYHSSSGFQNESIIDKTKIVDGKTLYFMDENGSKEGGLLGKIVLYIQPNNKITQSQYTNNFRPFNSTNGELHQNFLQLKRFRENNKLVSPDWRYPKNYGSNIGSYIDNRDDSYISRIFHMQSSAGDGQYENIQCTDVMFGVSDRPYEGLYVEYVNEQKVKNKLQKVKGCD